MHPPEKARQKCICEIVATSAAKPNICMVCDGKVE